MYLLILLMFMGLFAHDQLAGALSTGAPPAVSSMRMAALIVLPKIVLGLIYLLACRATLRRLGGRGGPRAMRWLEHIGLLFRLCILGLFVLDLRVGLLEAAQGFLGQNMILLPEMAVITPSLLLIVWGWFCFYPLDRRLRESTLMTRLDAGQPPPVFCTRGQYVLAQFRHQILLVLVPLLFLRGWIKLADRIPPDWFGGSADARPLVALAGAGVVFLLSPVVIRRLWDTAPLPSGPMRSGLIDLCNRHRVRVRELLLWRTFGGMVNAAVMGLIAPVRYILLTDALLETVPERQIEAVMAHEIGHVRRHHMLWLVIAAIAGLMVLELLWREALVGFVDLARTAGPADAGPRLAAFLSKPDNAVIAAMSGAILCWLVFFGWVSRRFERQADTFAVQHLASRYPLLANPRGGLLVDPQAVETMAGALDQIAHLNHISPRRNSWRHGSIQWRQDYLRGLVGRPVDDLPIDRLVFWIKLSAAITMPLVMAINAYFFPGA